LLDLPCGLEFARACDNVKHDIIVVHLCVITYYLLLIFSIFSYRNTFNILNAFTILGLNALHFSNTIHQQPHYKNYNCLSMSKLNINDLLSSLNHGQSQHQLPRFVETVVNDKNKKINTLTKKQE
jgi:hypothetical protein